MGEMSKIEEVAQRMAAKELDDGDGLYDWYALTDSVADKYRALAREAIEAMRVPTEAMVNAMRIASMNVAGGYDGPSGWESAIDAALKE